MQSLFFISVKINYYDCHSYLNLIFEYVFYLSYEIFVCINSFLIPALTIPGNSSAQDSVRFAVIGDNAVYAAYIIIEDNNSFKSIVSVYP